MPNPWDAGTAKFLHRLGFKALATTSAGLGFAQGLPDLVGAIPLDVTLENVRQIVDATPLPINADFQDAFSPDPDAVAENVMRCARTGVAGLSIEDATGDANQPLYASAVATERVRAARYAIDSTGDGVLLTARCEAWLVGDPNPLRTAIDRLAAYADAGADCLYAPGVSDPGDIAIIVRAVRPKPVNVLVGSAVPGLTVTRLADLGVRRISVGSALARVAWGAFMDAARNIQATGRFDALEQAAAFADINRELEAAPTNDY